MSRFIICFSTFVFGLLVRCIQAWRRFCLYWVGAFSLIRGKENRRQTATGAAGGE